MAKIKSIPENIGEYLKYDETSKTGLRWKKKTAFCVSIGDEAGNLTKTGYYRVGLEGNSYYNHRIIFFLHHNFCPACIDHIDNIPTNNKIDNLREATRSQNNHNSKISKNNTTGIKGLSSWTSQSGIEYWQCQIQATPGKTKKFRKDIPNSRQLAEQWLLDNRKEHHGEFANNG